MSTPKWNMTKKCLPGIEYQTLCRRHTRALNRECYLGITLKSFGPQHATRAQIVPKFGFGRPCLTAEVIDCMSGNKEMQCRLS